MLSRSSGSGWLSYAVRCVHLEERHGCTYEVFYARLTTDEAFVTGLREENPTWERDFHTWEFYAEELREWLNRLEQLSML